MPTITDIKRQKRTDTRYSVYLDNAYEFALTDLELSTSGLRIGQELSLAEVEDYRRRGEQGKGYAAALRYLSFRSRSRREMQDYLRRKGYEPADVQSTVERLEGAGLLNDQAFAAAWIANRQSLRPRSRRRLEQELTAKGVSREDISASLSEVAGDDELESLVTVIARKRQLPQYREPEKLMGYLARQGYTYDLIKKALEQLDEDA